MAGGTYGKFKNDSNREKNGVVLDMGDGGKFWVARAGGSNVAFQKRLQLLSKPHRRAIQIGSIDTKLADQILVQAYVETVLLKWEGVTDEKGEGLTFTKENAIKLFTDLPDLFRAVKETAEDETLFRAEILEADAGN